MSILVFLVGARLAGIVLFVVFGCFDSIRLLNWLCFRCVFPDRHECRSSTTRESALIAYD